MIKKISILALLMTVAFIGILSEPTEEATWLSVLLFSKVIGFAAIYAIYRLSKRWSVNFKAHEQ